MHQHCKEEFSDWPNGLLTIGTFGNNNLKHSDKCSQGPLDSGQDHLEPKDLEEVDKELIRLLNKHISLYSSLSDESEKHNLSVEKFLDCLKEDEKKADELMSENKDARLQRSTSLVQRAGKDIRLDNKTKGISKKSLSFLLKKAFVCRGGFVPNPMLRDPLPDPKLDHSRMEKILRAMLHKKIYPQRPTPKTASKKYLDMAETDSDEEQCEEASRRSKWSKQTRNASTDQGHIMKSTGIQEE
ncbi:UNVERIFIED_CONTAM: hypothetical protein Slati_3630500 [Sesamum latifolium]|uniref:Uncharacterized protein n=1 Tax=Sesamum latifolium TaxID=2727402 RepID=A0AAW2U0R2_9LAMI